MPRVVTTPRRFALTGFLSLALAVTASAYGPHNIPATSQIRAGDEVVLHQPLDAVAGSRIYLQHGKVVNGNAFQHREPFCYFHVYRDSAIINTAFRVTEDRFSITRTGRSIEYSMDSTPGYLLAAGGFFTQEASAQNMMIRFALDSPAQPDVRWLKCGIFAVPGERNYLAMEEVLETLGDLVTLNPGPK
jgi:hypothetical protein